MPGRAIGAAIDVGSNSVHLLVGIVDQGSLEPLDDESVQLGLGDTVDACGLLPDPTRETLIETIRAYVATAERLGAGHLTLVGTEPFRRAGNTTSVAADVLRRTGYPLHVLSHQAEAELTLLGVTHGRHPQDRLLVVNVGGGSTEVILVGAGGEPRVGAVRSGSARLSSLIVRHDPPTLTEVEALRAESRRLVAELPPASPERGMVVGGSGTNLALITRAEGSPPHITIATVERGLALHPRRPHARSLRPHSRSPPGVPGSWLPAAQPFIEAVSRRYGLDDLEVSDRRASASRHPRGMAGGRRLAGAAAGACCAGARRQRARRTDHEAPIVEATLPNGASPGFVRAPCASPLGCRDQVTVCSSGALREPLPQRLQSSLYPIVPPPPPLGERLDQPGVAQHREVLHHRPAGHARQTATASQW